MPSCQNPRPFRSQVPRTRTGFARGARLIRGSTGFTAPSHLHHSQSLHSYPQDDLIRIERARFIATRTFIGI